MSLKYRLILLTIAVFAVAFGGGTLVASRTARRLAESQLRRRLDRSAEALADSPAPLNEDVLARFAPVLGASILVLDAEGRPVAASGPLPGAEVAEAVAATAEATGGAVETSAGRFYWAEARRRLPRPPGELTVILLAEESAVTAPARAILRWFLLILCLSATVLAAGSYAVGLLIVRRLDRLGRRIDQTLAERPAATPARRGDEIGRLGQAFDDLLARLARSRDRLAAQQRLATAGKIAASVAHEVRNPLQSIRLTAEMLRESAGPGEREGVDLIIAEMDRLNLLTEELLLLGGKGDRRVGDVDPAAELAETLRLIKLQLRQRELTVQTDLADLPPVRMDPSRCRQLLLNLLLNAAEASPRGGRVDIRGRREGDRVVLEIADAGPGFPAEVLAGDAEEFFSTKTTGAGLGLSICRRIVAEAGGRLHLANRDGGGLAEVRLPVASPAAGGDTA
jgi:signal transduction histidine kinase